MVFRSITSEVAVLHVLEFREQVDKSFLMCSVFFGCPDFLVLSLQKAFHVLVLHVGVLIHLLRLVGGGFVVDRPDDIIEDWK